MTENAPWSLLIRGAKVYDGQGGPAQDVDVAVRGRQIAAVGPELNPAQAEHVIEADGLWLTPGLLDIHTHLDLEVELAPGLPEVVRHGTTTVVMSNCSLGMAFGAQRVNGQDPLVDCFARVENVPKPVLQKVADRVDWNSSADYLAHLRSLPLGPNVVPLIPHSMLRIEVMGLKDSVSRDPTQAELSRMEELVEQGMREGYAGFSTDALPFHYLANDPNRRVKIPTQFGSYQELKRLTNVVRRHGRVWQATPPKDSRVGTLRNFLLTSGRLFGRPLKITAVAALDVVSNKSILKMGLFLTRLLNSRVMRGHFRLQALAAPFKVYADGLITPLAEEIPAMRELNEPDLEDRAAREALLDGPGFRARFKQMWSADKSGWSVARLKRRLGIMDDTLTRDLSDMVMTERPLPQWQGQSLAQVYARFRQWQGNGETVTAAEAECFAALRYRVDDDADFLLALLRHYDTDLRWYMLAANADPVVLKRTLTHSQILPGFNDSGAHLTNMAFYDANLRGLQLLLDDGDAAIGRHVARLTREPAEFFGLDVGVIAAGWPADLVLIDPQALRRYDSEATTRLSFREEFGHEQMVNRSDGIVRAVYIGGERAWTQDGPGPQLGIKASGQLLTSGAALPKPEAQAA